MTTTDADRQARRDAIRDLINRIGRAITTITKD